MNEKFWKRLRVHVCKVNAHEGQDKNGVKISENNTLFTLFYA